MAKYLIGLTLLVIGVVLMAPNNAVAEGGVTWTCVKCCYSDYPECCCPKPRDDEGEEYGSVEEPEQGEQSVDSEEDVQYAVADLPQVEANAFWFEPIKATY